jgi:protein involved in polysaccharide export with SLBB domain
MPQAGRIIRVKRADTTRPTPAGADVMNGWEQYTLDPLNQGALTAITLDNGDTIDVPTAPQYFINGYVVNPGQYQWEPSLTLERAILKAGGATKDGATNRTSVKRLDQKTGESKDVDLGSDKMQFQIQPNDVIYVPKKRFELSQ